MELRLREGAFEFLLAGFFLGILFALSIVVKWYGEPVTFGAILLFLILASLFVFCFILGSRARKSGKLTVPVVS